VKKETREVQAQAGKLGITIDTTKEGPAVHKIKDESQMKGKLKVGDIILKIDDIDTTAMSASAISALMVRTYTSICKLSLTVWQSNRKFWFPLSQVKTEEKERTLTVLGVVEES